MRASFNRVGFAGAIASTEQYTDKRPPISNSKKTGEISRMY